MSRFWTRLLRVVPRFDGTDEEAIANVDSHHWTRLDLSKFSELSGKTFPPLIVCKTCEVLADSNAAEWPCGQSPPAETLEETAAKKRLTP